MKNTYLIIYFIFVLATEVLAQKNEIITVNAGASITDCIPFNVRYRYPEFTDGKVFYKNGAFSVAKLNYNFLTGEMDYLQVGDTLSIANVTDIKLITVKKDTFYFDNGFLELIKGGSIRVALKQYLKLLDKVNKDSYGSSGSGSATDSYSDFQTTGKNFKLQVNEDRIFKKTLQYYISVSQDRFVSFTRKNVMKLFPEKKDTLRDYLKSAEVNFNSKEDILRLANYLSTI